MDNLLANRECSVGQYCTKAMRKVLLAWRSACPPPMPPHWGQRSFLACSDNKQDGILAPELPEQPLTACKGISAVEGIPRRWPSSSLFSGDLAGPGSKPTCISQAFRGSLPNRARLLASFSVTTRTMATFAQRAKALWNHPAGPKTSRS